MKKQNTNKLLSMLLAMVMLASTFALPAYAADGEAPAGSEISAAAAAAGSEEENPAEEATSEEASEPEAVPAGEATDEETPAPEAVPAEEATSEEAPEPEAVPAGEATDEETPAPEAAPAGESSREEAPEPEAAFATVEDFLNACAAMGDAGDEDSVKAVLAGIEAVYSRLSEEGKAAVADEWTYVSSYRDQVNAGSPDAGIETMAQIRGESFTVRVVKVVNGNEVDSTVLTPKCLQSTGHSGYNHSTNLRALADASGFSGYKGYNWSSYTTVPNSYTSGLCPNNNYAGVHYNITGSAPYKAVETLYLFFETSKTFTLKYSANGGSGAPSQQTATGSADSYRFTVSSTVPTRNGYNFLGWSTRSNAVSASYSAGSSIDVTGTTTLYAVWEQKANEKVTLTYNANGGSNPPAAVTQDKGSEFVIKNAGQMSHENYTFLGWSTVQTATKADFAPGDGVTLNASITLYAVWKRNVSQTANYTVRWYTTEGDPIKQPETRTGTVGNSVAVTEQDKIISGYAFDAGNQGNVTTAILAPSGTVLTLYFNKTVTVIWVNEDGTTVLDGPKTFLKGEAEPTTNVQPAKAEDEDYTYAFDTWERTEDADGNVTYRATYTATPKTPENPGTDPENPGTDPENPGTDPENPGTDPENPGTDPENPGTDPENPGTDPENPGTDPENPGTDPENPGTDPEDPTPGDPTPADPTPAAPVDPTPAPAVTPAAPAAPAGPAPAPAAAPADPAEELPEEEAPLAAPEAAPAAPAAQETLEEEDTPLAGFGRPAWALLNLILMLCTALASVLLLIGYLGKKKKELVDEDGRRVLDAEGNAVYEWIKKRHGGWRLFSLIPAVVALIAFILTEDMRLPMVFTDRWTLLMALIALVQLIVCFFAKKEQETSDNNTSNPGGPAPAQA